MKKHIPPIAAALLLASNLAHAVPTTWELLNESMGVMGTFLLDIDAQTTSGANIGGDFGYYTLSSYADLNTSFGVAHYTVNNYFRFFSTATSQVYRTEHGGGEYSEIRVNDSSIEIGTLSGVLVPGGGLYEAVINEIYNYDESYATCSYYEEIYDPDLDEYITTDNCLFLDVTTNFNFEDGYSYTGYLRSLPVTAEVPIPPSSWLLLMGLLGFGMNRRRGLPGSGRPELPGSRPGRK